jgi:phage baseplate assembly protein V
MDLQELSRRLENLLRFGTIHSVDHAAVRCRVQSGGLLTDWLRWHTPRAGATRTWDPPTIGEQAIVLSPSGELGAGIVFYGLNSDDNPAPSHSPDEHVIAYPDGTRITYDHAASALTATGIKTALIEASEQTTIDCPENTITGNLLVNGNVQIDGNTVIKGTATIEMLLSYLAGMSGKTGAGGGSTTIEGDISHTAGDLSSNGVTLHTHTHGGVLAGGANTGGPT